MFFGCLVIDTFGLKIVTHQSENILDFDNFKLSKERLQVYINWLAKLLPFKSNEWVATFNDITIKKMNKLFFAAIACIAVTGFIQKWAKSIARVWIVYG